MHSLASVFDSVFAFNWRGFYEVVRIVFIVIDVALLYGFIYAFVKSLKYRPKFYANPKGIIKKPITRDPEFLKRWAKVIEKAKSSPPHSYILGVIEADNFVDDVLKKLGFVGETMADRLGKLNSANMKTLERLWRVHKVRNELVHNPDFNMSRLDAGEILRTYQDFLKELGVL